MRLLNFFFCFLVLLLSGCASSKSYWEARVHDALDILTWTKGQGWGAKAAIGPFQPGFYVGSEDRGLRGGLPDYRWSDRGKWNELQYFPLPLVLIPPLILESGHANFGISAMPSRTCLNNHAVAPYILPFIAVPQPQTYNGRGWTVTLSDESATLNRKRELEKGEHAWQYLTQCDLVLGLGYSIRLGANPGELLDFLLGWAALDIYGDDRYPDGRIFKRETEENREGKKP